MTASVDSYLTDGCGRCARFRSDACSARVHGSALAELRRICLAAGLEETVKWAHPCYGHAGRNIAVMGAFRADVRLSFFNAELLGDPDAVLEPAGPNSAGRSVMRFASAGAVLDRAGILSRYLAEAMGHAEAGRRAPRRTASFEMPDELLEAMEADPELAEAFHALTPGRQRSHAIVLGQAKKPETRVARIARLRPAILAGKGANER